MVHIGDNALAGLTGHGSLKRHAARRHVDNLTREFTPVRQHVAAEQVNLHALMAPAFLGRGRITGLVRGSAIAAGIGKRLFSAASEPRSLSLTLR